MGLWDSIKNVLTKSPVEEYRDKREADKSDDGPLAPAPTDIPAEVPVDVPEVPQDDASSGEATTPVEVPPASAPATPAEPEPDYRTYTVKSGDTLSEIAQQYGVDWHEMATLNDLENPDLIFPGQVFKIPNS